MADPDDEAVFPASLSKVSNHPRTVRRLTWATCIVALAACLLLLLFGRAQYRSKRASETPMVPLPGAADPHPATTVSSSEQAPPQTNAAHPSIVNPAPPISGESNALNAEFLANWQAPIEFYGKVIDEESNAVVGGKATFHWADAASPDGNRTRTAESSAE